MRFVVRDAQTQGTDAGCGGSFDLCMKDTAHSL